MTPGEIRACYRLYAAHRRSHEICTFPETPTMNSAGDLDGLAVLLRLHTSFEGLARGIAERDPGDHSCWTRRSLAKDARVVRCPVVRSRRSGGTLRALEWPQL